MSCSRALSWRPSSPVGLGKFLARLGAARVCRGVGSTHAVPGPCTAHCRRSWRVAAAQGAQDTGEPRAGLGVAAERATPGALWRLRGHGAGHPGRWRFCRRPQEWRHCSAKMRHPQLDSVPAALLLCLSAGYRVSVSSHCLLHKYFDNGWKGAGKRHTSFPLACTTLWVVLSCESLVLMWKSSLCCVGPWVEFVGRLTDCGDVEQIPPSAWKAVRVMHWWGVGGCTGLCAGVCAASGGGGAGWSKPRVTSCTAVLAI